MSPEVITRATAAHLLGVPPDRVSVLASMGLVERCGRGRFQRASVLALAERRRTGKRRVPLRVARGKEPAPYFEPAPGLAPDRNLHEAAALLGYTYKYVCRLATDGYLQRTARGRVGLASIHAYLAWRDGEVGQSTAA